MTIRIQGKAARRVRNLATSQRKVPRQARARVTVEAILEATAQLLVADGMARLTTNRIAKRAGVSVGTLYQYFPDKQSIVRALGEQVLERQIQAFEAELLSLAGMAPDLEQSVRMLVVGMLAGKRMQPELAHVLLNHTEGLADDWEQAWLDRQRKLVRSALHIHRDSVRAGDPDVMSYVLTTSFEYILQDALKHQPHLVADGRLAGELAELAIRYIRPDPEP